MLFSLNLNFTLYFFINLHSRLLRIFHLVISSPKFDILRKRIKSLGILNEQSQTSFSTRKDIVSAKANLNRQTTRSRQTTWVGKFSNLSNYLRVFHVVKNLYFVFQVRIHCVFSFFTYYYLSYYHITYFSCK